MDHSFTCPDCGRAHREPFEATFVLHVRCCDCTLFFEIAEDVAAERELLVAAA